MYQLHTGPCNIDASAMVMRNQNSRVLSLPRISHLTLDESVNLRVLLPQRRAVRVSSLVFQACSDTALTGAT